MLITKSKKRWISNIECVDKSQKDYNEQNKPLKERAHSTCCMISFVWNSVAGELIFGDRVNLCWVKMVCSINYKGVL